MTRRRNPRPPWLSWADARSLRARFGRATRGEQAVAVIVCLFVVGVLGVVAYLLIAGAFSIGPGLGVVVTLAVAFSLVGLFALITGVAETFLQRRSAKPGTSSSDELGGSAQG